MRLRGRWGFCDRRGGRRSYRWRCWCCWRRCCCRGSRGGGGSLSSRWRCSGASRCRSSCSGRGGRRLCCRRCRGCCWGCCRGSSSCCALRCLCCTEHGRLRLVRHFLSGRRRRATHHRCAACCFRAHHLARVSWRRDGSLRLRRSTDLGLCGIEYDHESQEGREEAASADRDFLPGRHFLFHLRFPDGDRCRRRRLLSCSLYWFCGTQRVHLITEARFGRVVKACGSHVVPFLICWSGELGQRCRIGRSILRIRRRSACGPRASNDHPGGRSQARATPDWRQTNT